MSGEALGWWPTPRYLHRFELLRELLAGQPHGRVLEVGFGAGHLLAWLASQGHAVHGLDSSRAAHAAAAARLSAPGPAVGLHHSEGELGSLLPFDVVVACEVLEHIEDDLGCLRRWHGWLRPGGRLLLSVPAHMRRWGPLDDWAGHVRRYERAQLVELCQQSGLELETLWCYGFPLCNWLEPLNAWLYRKRGAAATPAESTARSGVDRGAFRRLAPLSRGLVLWPFLRAQRLVLGRDWGNGYLLAARRPGARASSSGAASGLEQGGPSA